MAKYQRQWHGGIEASAWRQIESNAEIIEMAAWQRK
jgi:hypothetical protein